MCLINSFKPIRDLLGDDPEHEYFIEFKKEESAEYFCEFNDTPYLIEVLTECYDLKYEEEPNYSKIIFLL